MLIDHPAGHQTVQLRQLWKIAFGDPDGFLDIFFESAFAPERCRCLVEDGRVAAVLYWFDCTVSGRKTAYLYAIATHPDFRGRGFCHSLMADTHTLLASRGYTGSLLVPQSESLRKLYAGMGYRNAGGLDVLHGSAGTASVSIRAIGPAEFARLRRQFLPEGGVLQEGENLAFLSRQLQFYTGPGFLLTAYAEEDTLHGVEFLGDRAAVSGILNALKLPRGILRTPGRELPFAMYLPLQEDAPVPSYFGFAFD